MSESFVVEANRKVVGVAVRCRGGFRFFASDPVYRRLERRVFRHARSLAFSVGNLERDRLRGRDDHGAALH